ncbi:hypothetical protein [Streptomyces sp. NPDC002537]
MDAPPGPIVITAAGSGPATARVRPFAQDGHPPPFLGRRLERPVASPLPHTLRTVADVTPVTAVRDAENAYGPVGPTVNSAGVTLTGGPVTRDREPFGVNGIPRAVEFAVRAERRQTKAIRVIVRAAAGRTF